METIAIASITGLILFIIGVFCGKISSFDDGLCCSINSLKVGSLDRLESKVYMLESENRRLNHLWESLIRDRSLSSIMANYTKCECDRSFIAKSQKEQEVADMLKNITLTSEEIAKKLGMKIE